MPGQGRLFDLCICGAGSIGVYVTGSLNVITNGRPTLRIGNVYVCPHCTGMAVSGSPNVLTNGIPNHRLGDTGCDCDGCGFTITASGDTIIN